MARLKPGPCYKAFSIELFNKLLELAWRSGRSRTTNFRLRLGHTETAFRKTPQGLKPEHPWFMARLKPCPCYKAFSIELFNKLLELGVAEQFMARLRPCPCYKAFSIELINTLLDLGVAER